MNRLVWSGLLSLGVLSLGWTPPARTKMGGCTVDGLRPDAACTPGAVATTSLSVVCGTSTRARRHLSRDMRARVLRSYGMPSAGADGYEIDHLVPLELGGSNDLANLWPEAGPGFREKDRVEDYLHAQVCSGHMSLDAAQHAIASDWTAIGSPSP